MQSVRCDILLPTFRCSMSCAKMAEPIEMSFVVRTRGGRRKEPCSVGGSPDRPGEGAECGTTPALTEAIR